jgi:hypothetical protein
MLIVVMHPPKAGAAGAAHMMPFTALPSNAG